MHVEKNGVLKSSPMKNCLRIIFECLSKQCVQWIWLSSHLKCYASQSNICLYRRLCGVALSGLCNVFYLLDYEWAFDTSFDLCYVLILALREQRRLTIFTFTDAKRVLVSSVAFDVCFSSSLVRLLEVYSNLWLYLLINIQPNFSSHFSCLLSHEGTGCLQYFEFSDY